MARPQVKKNHPLNGLQGIGKPELETAIKQLTLDRALMESTLAIKNSELEELRIRIPKHNHQQIHELPRQALRLRVAKLEEKLVEEQKRNVVCDAALAIMPYQMAAAEIKLNELGLNKQDLDRKSEQLKKQETRIAENIESLKIEIEREKRFSPACKSVNFYQRTTL